MLFYDVNLLHLNLFMHTRLIVQNICHRKCLRVCAQVCVHAVTGRQTWRLSCIGCRRSRERNRTL